MSTLTTQLYKQHKALLKQLASAITPALCRQFGLAASEVWLEDAFIVKYAPRGEGGQPGLGFHRDDSELSFNILLSDAEGFEGGGTTFEVRILFFFLF